MTEPETNELEELTEIFRRYGADDPASWAHSQIREGIPQLAIFSFAKAMWKGVIDEEDTQWIDAEVASAERYPTGPCSPMGQALAEMLSKGVSKEAITDLVRGAQYKALFHVACLIDGSIIEDVPVTDWQLHHTDADGQFIAIIQGLDEVLLSLDPTGREMRPRPQDED